MSRIAFAQARRLGNWALCYAAPLLLCVVALRQVFLVHTQQLTPWKGGGFGMFSTMESGATRVMRNLLVRREGEKTLSLPVKLPIEMRAIAADLLQRPTERAASNLSVMLANIDWVEARELDAIYAMPPSALASLALSSDANGQSAPALREVLRKPRSWIRGLKSSADFGDGRSIEFDHAAVEVWQLRFEPKTRRLTLQKLIEANEARRKVPERKAS